MLSAYVVVAWKVGPGVGQGSSCARRLQVVFLGISNRGFLAFLSSEVLLYGAEVKILFLAFEMVLNL